MIMNRAVVKNSRKEYFNVYNCILWEFLVDEELLMFLL